MGFRTGNSRPLVAIVGPTGAGKSDLSMRVAEALDGEVVNCDSLQVYRYFDIGTAKLPVSQRGGVRHHLIDVLDPDELFTAGEYARRARAVVGNIAARGRTPVLAGGTGFYLRALLEGLAPGPPRDAVLRERLAAREIRRPGSLHRLLRRFDAAAAPRIHPNDVPKVTRALEIRLLTRRPATDLFAEGRAGLAGFRVLKVGLHPDRDALCEKLNTRCARMFEEGLPREVRRILALGFPPSVKPFESHGYRQALQYLSGELKLGEAIFYAQRNTRNYAKRQMTWFRREQAVVWVRGFGADEQVQAAALARVRAFLDSADLHGEHGD